LSGPATVDVATALLAHAAHAFPGAWGGVPAEVYCVASPRAAEVRERVAQQLARVVPADDCALRLQRGLPISEQRVRHLESGRPAIIYRLEQPRRVDDISALVDITWFAAYHFSAGYSCTLLLSGSRWRVQQCVQTSDYRSVGV
jgi:hypothetical protein